MRSFCISMTYTMRNPNKPDFDEEESPVESGDEVRIHVNDIHESGAGVGETEEGFVVFVEGILPECEVTVEITEEKGSFARGELVEEHDDYVVANSGETEDETDGKENNEDPRLGARHDYWG